MTSRIVGTGGRVALTGGVIPSAVIAAHLSILTAAAIVTQRSRAVGGAAASGPTPAMTCHVFVPAHDEAEVIADTVAALVAQRYPEECFDVHVVADNCTDETARIAAEAGACVHERVTPDTPGKGPALNWLLDEVAGDADDVIVIVDADTIASPGFLQAISSAMRDGADAVQGRYGVLDADASSATSLRWAALAVRHHLRPLGRRALGLSCGLFGNGMAFRRHVLESHRWSGHLTEDAEMALNLLLDGIPIRYAPDAAVEAEMPTTLDASESQHQRWELGRAQVNREFVPRLVRSALRRRTGRRLSRSTIVDAVMEQCLPPLSVLVAAQGALAVASLSLRARRALACGSLAVTFAHVVAGLWVAGAPSWVYRSLTGAPRLVVWKLWLLTGMSTGTRRTTWQRTRRNTR